MNSGEGGRVNVFGGIAAASLVIACVTVCLDSVGYPVRGFTLGLLVASWALGWSFALSRAQWPRETRNDEPEASPGNRLPTLPIAGVAALATTAAVLMRRLPPQFDELRLLVTAAGLLLGPGLSLGCVLLAPGTPLRERLIVAPSLSFGSILVATGWMAFLGIPLTASSLERMALALAAIGVARALAARSPVRAL